MQMIKGAKVPAAERLKEGYLVEERRITANVDADKILPIMEGFLARNEDIPLFFFIETPCNIAEETVVGKAENGAVLTQGQHKDVWYLDGISAKTVREIFGYVSDILVHDGLSAFGIGNPVGEEIGKYKYNIVQVFCREEHTQKYAPIFEEQGIPKTRNLITAWETFTQNTPGECEQYANENGLTIYDVIDWLKKHGMYRAEVRED